MVMPEALLFEPIQNAIRTPSRPSSDTCILMTSHFFTLAAEGDLPAAPRVLIAYPPTRWWWYTRAMPEAVFILGRGGRIGGELARLAGEAGLSLAGDLAGAGAVLIATPR